VVLIHYFLVFTAIYILMGWSVYLPYKVGHLHFLPVSIMAVCAYFAGIASRNWHWSFFPILLTGILIGLTVSYIVAKIIGDAPPFSVVIVGLTFIFIVKTVIENWDYLGGSIGLFGIPSIKYLVLWTYLLLSIVGYLISMVENSQLSRKAAVISEDRVLAASLGIRGKELVISFHTFSGIIAGLAGILYALLIGGLAVDFFGFLMIGTLMAILFVGGHSSMWGVVLAAPLLGGIPILLPNILITWKQVIYGGLLIAMIVFQPDGLISRRQALNWKKMFKK
jgi:branched-chain amino acid transport system permease protein